MVLNGLPFVTLGCFAYPPCGAASHASVQGGDDHRVQVIFSRGEKQLFLADAQYLTTSPALTSHLETRQRIRRKKLLIDGPIKNVPESAQVAVDGGIFDARSRVTPLSE